MLQNESNFYMTFNSFNNGFEEQTTYIPIISSQKSIIKYDNKLATSLLDFLNNYDNILGILDKYKKKCESFSEYSEFVTMFNNLKEEILKLSKNLYILIFFIDQIIYDILEIQNGNLYIENELYIYCVTFIFSLKEDLTNARTSSLSPFFRTYNVTGESLKYTGNIGKDFYTSAFETFTATELSLPKVKIKFENIEYNSNLKEKMEPYSFTYSIFSITDFVNVTLYHLQKNKKAILCCANCQKYFVPSTHIKTVETKNIHNKLIKERNTRITCSEYCANRRRTDKTKLNLYGYKKEKKNLRDNLRNYDKRHNTNHLKEFDLNFKTKENEILKKYGNNNLEIIEEELLKCILSIKESNEK